MIFFSEMQQIPEATLAQHIPKKSLRRVCKLTRADATLCFKRLSKVLIAIYAKLNRIRNERSGHKHPSEEGLQQELHHPLPSCGATVAQRSLVSSISFFHSQKIHSRRRHRQQSFLTRRDRSFFGRCTIFLFENHICNPLLDFQGCQYI